uniref:Anaphase-promoting complex subunit 4 WD40 domain-containing protein n=1 Tax=Astatotilapia calliptera TaxID=8154 RepID=A0AAX7VVI5_ASTCA
MAAVLELVAGSYEQITFGYQVKTDEKEWTAKAEFTHHAHTASVSAVAASERFVVTGSKDETIQVYNMKKRIEHGALLHHDGTITCLEFYGTSHLLSGGEDGLLCVWSTKKWECLKSIKAHKTWNLINGRSAFIKNIKQNAHIVRWSPDGDRYVVVMNDKVNIYVLETATVTGTVANPKRIASVNFLNNSILAVAGDDETVRLCDVEKAKWVCDFKAHETRVKTVDSVNVDDYSVVVTASNDGFIKMWKIHLKEELEPPTLLGEVNTSARLTCLAVRRTSPMQQEITEEEAPQATTSEELLPELLRTKRVRIATEVVVLEDESKPKKKKKKNSGK